MFVWIGLTCDLCYMLYLIKHTQNKIYSITKWNLLLPPYQTRRRVNHNYLLTSLNTAAIHVYICLPRMIHVVIYIHMSFSCVIHMPFTCCHTHVMHMLSYTCHSHVVIHMPFTWCHAHVIDMLAFTCPSHVVIHMSFTCCHTHAIYMLSYSCHSHVVTYVC